MQFEQWQAELATTWGNMISRCYQEANSRFSSYGGRGIKVAERWHVFENFVTDLGPRPAGMSLDRIDNDGDYSPENCRWADRFVQGQNKRNNINLTIDGVTKPLTEWARESGVSVQAVRNRVYKGCSHKDAVFGVRERAETVVVEHDGQTRTIAEWAEVCGLDRSVIRARLKRGRSAEDALTRPVHDPRKIEFRGESLTSVGWSKRVGIPATYIKNRLKMGWSVERALTEPIHEQKKIEFQGKSLTVAEWSKLTGISKALIRHRLSQGWSTERVLTQPMKPDKRRHAHGQR